MKSRLDLSAVFEICLQKLEAGTPLDVVIAEYPRLADELRPLLEAACLLYETGQEGLNGVVPMEARAISKAQFLAEADRRHKQARLFSLRSLLRFPQAHMGSLAFALAAIFLIVVAVSSTRSLPGDELYPLKIAAEKAGISLANNSEVRETQVDSYDQKRVAEIEQMFAENRDGEVQFAGFLKHPTPQEWWIDKIPVVFSPEMEDQALSLQDVYVEVSGHAHEYREVHIDKVQPRMTEINGNILVMGTDYWQVSNLIVHLTDQTRITGQPEIGKQVVVKAARLTGNQEVRAFEIRVPVNPTARVETETASPTPTNTRAAPMIIQPTVQPVQEEPPQPTPTQQQPASPPKPTATQQPVQPAPTATSQPTEDDHHEQSTPEVRDEEPQPTATMVTQITVPPKGHDIPEPTKLPDQHNGSQDARQND